MLVDDDVVRDTQGEMPVEVMAEWQKRFRDLFQRIA
jgi:hypothetical protein